MLEPAGDRRVVLRPSPDSCWPRFPVKRGVERGQSAGNRRDAALPSSPNLYVCWLYVGVDVEHRSRSGRTRRSRLHRASGRAMHVKHLAGTSFRPGPTSPLAHAGGQGPPSWSPPALSHRDKSALFPVKPLPKAREAADRITSDVSEPDGQLRRSTRNPPLRADRQVPGKRCRRPRAGSCGKGASTWQGSAPGLPGPLAAESADDHDPPGRRRHCRPTAKRIRTEVRSRRRAACVSKRNSTLRPVIHVVRSQPCTVCRTLWTTTSRRLSGMCAPPVVEARSAATRAVREIT